MFNPWVGQNPTAGKDSPLITRISPYFFSQHGLSNIYYLPKLRDLPASAVDFKAIVFDFGFNAGTYPLPPSGAAKVLIGIERPLLIWGIAATSAYTGGAHGFDPGGSGFQFQLLHSHQGHQRQFFSKFTTLNETAGQGGTPLVFRMPYMVMKGDELTCQVRNTTPGSNGWRSQSDPIDCQVVVYGGEFD